MLHQNGATPDSEILGSGPISFRDGRRSFADDFDHGISIFCAVVVNPLRKIRDVPSGGIGAFVSIELGPGAGYHVPERSLM